MILQRCEGCNEHRLINHKTRLCKPCQARMKMAKGKKAIKTK